MVVNKSIVCQYLPVIADSHGKMLADLHIILSEDFLFLIKDTGQGRKAI